MLIGLAAYFIREKKEEKYENRSFTDAYKPQISGVTTSLNMLAEGLIKKGHEVYIITTKTKGSKEYDADKPYIKDLERNTLSKERFRNISFCSFCWKKSKTCKETS